MKNKLRKIVVNNRTYYFRFAYKYQKKFNNDYECISYFRAYVVEHKDTPLIITIKTVGDYIIGNTLNVGVNGINLNQPKWARKLILWGLDRKWNGNKKVELECTYELLEEMK